jgi:hypothetical protein
LVAPVGIYQSWFSLGSPTGSATGISTINCLQGNNAVLAGVKNPVLVLISRGPSGSHPQPVVDRLPTISYLGVSGTSLLSSGTVGEGSPNFDWNFFAFIVPLRHATAGPSAGPNYITFDGSATNGNWNFGFWDILVAYNVDASSDTALSSLIAQFGVVGGGTPIQYNQITVSGLSGGELVISFGDLPGVGSPTHTTPSPTIDAPYGGPAGAIESYIINPNGTTSETWDWHTGFTSYQPSVIGFYLKPGATSVQLLSPPTVFNISTPNLPVAPLDYQQGFIENVSNVLRLYFNTISNSINASLSNIVKAITSLDSVYNTLINNIGLLYSKLIYTFNNTILVTGSTPVAFVSIPVTSSNIIPVGCAWKIKTTAKCLAPPVAGTQYYLYVSAFGTVIGGTPFPQSGVSASGNPATFATMECIISNTGAGSYTCSSVVWNDANPSTPAAATITIMTNTQVVNYAATPIIVYGATSAASGQIQHYLTTIELLQN